RPHPLLSPGRAPPPRSTLFPYTTLFRSVRPRPSCAASPRCSAWKTSSSSNNNSRESDMARILAVDDSASMRDMVAYTLRTAGHRSEEHTSELQSRENLVCRLLLEKKKDK